MRLFPRSWNIYTLGKNNDQIQHVTIDGKSLTWWSSHAQCTIYLIWINGLYQLPMKFSPRHTLWVKWNFNYKRLCLYNHNPPSLWDKQSFHYTQILFISLFLVNYCFSGNHFFHLPFTCMHSHCDQPSLTWLGIIFCNYVSLL